MTETDPIERAKSHARQMYPEARISTRSHAGKPVVLATQDNLVRLVRLVELDAISRTAQR